MIEQSLVLLKDELEEYIRMVHKDISVNVIVGNIGLFEIPSGDPLLNNIVITLVNIEEEFTLKNQRSVRRTGNNTAIYLNHPVHLNLYILLTCNYSGNDYRSALRRLSYIIQFMQSKTYFSTATTAAGGNNNTDEVSAIGIKFTMELFTLSFEQINHLWGSLGGRQVPFAMYKLRLVTISENALVREEPLIEEISSLIKASAREE